MAANHSVGADGSAGGCGISSGCSCGTSAGTRPAFRRWWLHFRLVCLALRVVVSPAQGQARAALRAWALASGSGWICGITTAIFLLVWFGWCSLLQFGK